MIRGVNKHIIEVTETENEYFERAILFVRPDMIHLNDAELRMRATKLLIGMGQPGGSLKRASRVVTITRMACCALIGAAVATLLMKVLFL